MIDADLILFHGGRLDGPVELRTRGRMAYGPGFYMTTSYWTAREYRGGGGRVYRVRVKMPLRWDYDVRLARPEVDAMLASIEGLKNRGPVAKDLDTSFGRSRDGKVSMTNVMNVLDNNNSYGRIIAREVALAMVNAGCDATLIEGANGGDEDWVCLHNVSRIRDVTALDGPEDDRPRLRRT